eukprot:1884705-Rhodomonas_salina.1
MLRERTVELLAARNRQRCARERHAVTPPCAAQEGGKTRRRTGLSVGARLAGAAEAQRAAGWQTGRNAACAR